MIDTLPDIPSTVSSSIAVGRVIDQAGRNFRNFGFEYSTGSTVPNMLEGNAVTSSYPTTIEFTSSIELAFNTDYYYRAWAEDLQTGVKYYGDIESIEAKPAYAYPFRYENALAGTPRVILADVIADRDDIMATQCGLVIPSAETIYIASEFSTGSNPTPPYGCSYPDGPYTINDFIGQTAWTDVNLSIPLALNDKDEYEPHMVSVHGLNTQNDFTIFKERAYPITLQHKDTIITSGSLSCPAPNDCNPT